MVNFAAMGTIKKGKVVTEVEITGAAAEGKALGKVNDMVVFVEQAVPGDLVDVRIHKKRKKYAQGRAVHIHRYSEKRQEPFCDHFGTCGGCKWQNLQYQHQLTYKQQQVTDNLSRLANIELPEVFPILPSAQTEFYRNKLEFTFSNNRWITEEEAQAGGEIEQWNALGFHIPGRFDKIVDVEKCHLQGSHSNDIRNTTRAYALEHGLTFFDLKKQEGFLRNLIIRTASTGELMAIFAFFHEDEAKRIALLDHIAEQFPDITALMYVINPKKNDTISDLDIQVYKGRDHIFEEMEGLRFKIGPKSFYQTNSAQAYELYKIARTYADIKDDDLVYDLYTGTGTIANFVAGSAKKVIGIEYVPEAIEDAKENSRHNNIDNTDFYAGDMKDVLNDAFIDRHGKPDVVITDPPRAGMHEDVVNKILDMEAERVVYVSCNPATQARDLDILNAKYEVIKVQPVDMFPHTHHVENVVLLHKRD